MPVRTVKRVGLKLRSKPLRCGRIGAKRCVQPLHRGSDLWTCPVPGIELRQIGLGREKLYPPAGDVARLELQYDTRNGRHSRQAIERPEAIDAGGHLGQ